MPLRSVVQKNLLQMLGWVVFYFSYLQITSGEYIQMSGRAGRRGIDDRGIVILIVDEKMGPDVGKELLKVLLYIEVFFSIICT